jgi:hypothetical protein
LRGQQLWKEVKKKETEGGNSVAQVQREFARMLDWRCGIGRMKPLRANNEGALMIRSAGNLT